MATVSNTSQDYQDYINAMMNQKLDQQQLNQLGKYGTSIPVTGAVGTAINWPQEVHSPQYDLSMTISILTLMMTVGPDVARRMLRKLGVDEKMVNRAGDIARDTNDTNLDKVVEECAKELKI